MSSPAPTYPTPVVPASVIDDHDLFLGVRLNVMFKAPELVESQIYGYNNAFELFGFSPRVDKAMYRLTKDGGLPVSVFEAYISALHAGFVKHLEKLAAN